MKTDNLKLLIKLGRSFGPVLYLNKQLIFSIVFITFFLLLSISYIYNLYIISGIANSKNYASLENNISSDLIDLINKKNEEHLAEIARQEYRSSRISKVENFFNIYNAVIKGYGYLFVDAADRCGGDYSVLVGIAGAESALGRSPIRSYNPFGYLDGDTYDSWESAISHIACEISQTHISKCGQDLWCMVNRYTGPESDKDLWVRNVGWFMRQVQ